MRDNGVEAFIRRLKQISKDKNQSMQHTGGCGCHGRLSTNMPSLQGSMLSRHVR